MVALYHQASEVKAVEINPAMIEMVTQHYADFLGNLFDNPRVELILEDGRAYARRDTTQFDIIQMSGVDTYTALSTGAYTLSESYLYTVEAVKDFYARLTDDGYINYSRFLLRPPKRPRETIRLVSVARQALAELGVKEPWRHIVVLQAQGWASTMIKKSPFTEIEVQGLRDFAAEQNFKGLVADPFKPRGEQFEFGRWPDAKYTNTAKSMVRAFAESFGISVEGALPPDLVRPVEAGLRQITSGQFEQAVQTIQPLLAGLPDDKRPQATERLRKNLGAFRDEWQAAGEHFMRMQKDFETLLRSDDEERADFVSRYFYELTPSTDDKPFFFNYYRFDQLFKLGEVDSWDQTYHPDVPVGHMVLLSSMLQIVLLGAFLIFWPLRRLKNLGTPLPQAGKGRVFLYFAALGMGFMFVEICLMQKFVLFLGHPAYALSVVLAGILLFSGLGAWFSARFDPLAQGFRWRLLTAVLLVTAFELLAVNVFLTPLLAASFPMRVLAAVGLLAPAGFVLGMPFPLGIRALDAHAPALVPWGWAINGFLSVFSSLAAIILAMAIGFTGVLITGAAIYALGLAQLPFRSESDS